VGEKGRLNTGRLTVVTPPHSFMDQFFINPAASIDRVLTGDAGVNADGRIEIAGEINALEGLALHAGSVVNTGRLSVDVTQGPDFTDLVNVDGLEQGGEIRVTNGGIEIVATGDVVSTGEITTAVSGYEAVDAGNINIDAGSRIVLEKGAVVDASSIGFNASGGDVTFTAGAFIDFTGKAYTGVSEPPSPSSDPTAPALGGVFLNAPHLRVGGMVDAGPHANVHFTAESDAGEARIILDGAWITGRDILLQATAVLENQAAVGLTRARTAATIDLLSKDTGKFTIIEAARDVQMTAENRTTLQVAASTASGDAYDAGYAVVDVDATARVHLDTHSGVVA
jgi:hypothetical protein